MSPRKSTYSIDPALAVQSVASRLESCKFKPKQDSELWGTSPLLSAVAVCTVAAMWFPAWLARKQYSSPNVDDYFYTHVASVLWLRVANGDLFGAMKTFLATGHVAPLVPALGAPLSSFGPDVAVLVQLPLLLVLTLAVFGIVERTSGASVGLFSALVTALCAPVLGWSLMMHMALASATCSLGVIHSYLRSAGFAHRSQSALVGLWVGLLALSRSMAPVFLSALGIALVASALIFRKRQVTKNLSNVVLATIVAGIVAGPWYWYSGPTALRYLRSVGYSASSGFVVSGNPVRNRLQTALQWMGWALIAFVLLLLVAALVEGLRGGALRKARAATTEPQFLLLAFALLTMAFLSTTGNSGTAFELPAIAASIPGLALCLRPESPAWRVVTPAGALTCGLALLQAWLLPGWESRSPAAPSPFYATGTVQAVGLSLPRTSALARQVASMVRDLDILVTRDDAVVNAEGLRYFKFVNRWQGIAKPAPFDPAAKLVTVEGQYEFVLGGQSCASYHPHVDQSLLAASLDRDGWAKVLSLRFSSCNQIDLWQRPDSGAAPGGES